MRVDYLLPDLTGFPVKIGMMRAPAATTLDAILAALAGEHRVSLLVSLIGDVELDALGLRDLVQRAEAAGIEVVRFPIDGFCTPSSMRDFIALIERILAAAEAERNIVLHCWAGLGRTGLVAASCLVTRGFSATDAIATVRRHRPGTVETEEQEEFVADFSRAWAERAEARALQST